MSEPRIDSTQLEGKKSNRPAHKCVYRANDTLVWEIRQVNSNPLNWIWIHFCVGSLQFHPLNIFLWFLSISQNSFTARHVNSAGLNDHNTFFSSKHLRSRSKHYKQGMHILINSLFPAFSKEQIKGNQCVYIQVGLVLTFKQVIISDKRIHQMRTSKKLKCKTILETTQLPFQKEPYPKNVIRCHKKCNACTGISLFC